MIKKRRHNNATALHEANFAKLARVVPGLRDLEESVCVRGPNDTRLELRILEISKFTKTFSLNLIQGNNQTWLPCLHMKVRIYYDAKVTEVLAFQRHHRLNSRYSYPNAKMYQSNEKWQTNQFLGEWLDHCIRTRCTFQDEMEFLDA